MKIVKALIFLLIVLSVAVTAQPIPSSTLIGDWIIAARITSTDIDTVWCEDDCGTISFSADYRAQIVSNQEQELSFKWLITDQTLNFYELPKKRRRRKKQISQIPGIFVITDLGVGNIRKVFLMHTKDAYGYMLLPDTLDTLQ